MDLWVVFSWCTRVLPIDIHICIHIYICIYIHVYVCIYIRVYMYVSRLAAMRNARVEISRVSNYTSLGRTTVQGSAFIHVT